MSARKAIISIQSQVAFGHVGLSAASLPLQRLGFDVWPVPTVVLAHHPGYGRWQGFAPDLEQISLIVRGLATGAPLDRVQALHSGYLGAAGAAELVAEMLAAVRAAQPRACYLCDPVIGDRHSGIFVHPEIPRVMQDRLLPLADIITPNQFELSCLSGCEANDLNGALEAAARLRARGPRLVVATGLELADRPDQLCVLAAGAKEAFLVATPHLQATLSGAGDAFCALLLGHLARTEALRTALERATAAMYRLALRTVMAMERELCLVEAQDEFVDPAISFKAMPVP